jgi:hypothetical protein
MPPIDTFPSRKSTVKQAIVFLASDITISSSTLSYFDIVISLSAITRIIQWILRCLVYDVCDVICHSWYAGILPIIQAKGEGKLPRQARGKGGAAATVILSLLAKRGGCKQ